MAHSCFKMDRENLRDYIKAGYKTIEKGGLLPVALITDEINEMQDSSTREPSPDDLAESDAEKEGWKLLENTLYEDSGGWCTSPGSYDHEILRRTVFQCWKVVGQRSDHYEPSIPYHRRIFPQESMRTWVSHALATRHTQEPKTA